MLDLYGLDRSVSGRTPRNWGSLFRIAWEIAITAAILLHILGHHS